MTVRKIFSEFRKSLGRKKKLWRIKASKERENCFIRDLNHKISAGIIDQAKSVENPVIVLEDLKHIRRKINTSREWNHLLHSWPFRQLQDFIEYKAKWNSIPVIYVSPKYSSQRCSKCGFVSKNNRHKRVFKCIKCGYELNADLNAAINIAKNFSSDYMSGEMGDVTTPQTLAKNSSKQTITAVVDQGSHIL